MGDDDEPGLGGQLQELAPGPGLGRCPGPRLLWTRGWRANNFRASGGLVWVAGGRPDRGRDVRGAPVSPCVWTFDAVRIFTLVRHRAADHESAFHRAGG